MVHFQAPTQEIDAIYKQVEDKLETLKKLDIDNSYLFDIKIEHSMNKFRLKTGILQCLEKNLYFSNGTTSMDIKGRTNGLYYSYTSEFDLLADLNTIDSLITYFISQNKQKLHLSLRDAFHRVLELCKLG